MVSFFALLQAFSKQQNKKSDSHAGKRTGTVQADIRKLCAASRHKQLMELVADRAEDAKQLSRRINADVRSSVIRTDGA